MKLCWRIDDKCTFWETFGWGATVLKTEFSLSSFPTRPPRCEVWPHTQENTPQYWKARTSLTVFPCSGLSDELLRVLVLHASITPCECGRSAWLLSSSSPDLTLAGDYCMRNPGWYLIGKEKRSLMTMTREISHVGGGYRAVGSVWPGGSPLPTFSFGKLWRQNNNLILEQIKP